MSCSSVPLSLAIARSLLDAARALATNLAIPFSVAVVDAGGREVATERMDGAGWMTLPAARGKAIAAAAWRCPTGELAERFERAPGLIAGLAAEFGAGFVVARGGIPLTSEGSCIGGIGASGGTGEQDEELVARAIASLV